LKSKGKVTCSSVKADGPGRPTEVWRIVKRGDATK